MTQPSGRLRERVLRPLEPLSFNEHQQVTVTVSDHQDGG